MKHIEPEKTYKSFCWTCCNHFRPVMLSTYSLKGFPCDACGNVADLAMVVQREDGKAEPCLTATQT